MWLLSNKVPVRDSGILEGFRDCHCHLLPSVDDGVKKKDETLRILEEWEEMGVSEIWLTPHIMEDYPNTPEDLKEKFDDLATSYNGSIKLHLAAEHMMDGLFTSRLKDDWLLPIGEEGDRLLVETSYYIPPMNMESILENIRRKGYNPILAHPERYQYMESRDYKKWKQKGVLLQLNVPSLVGAYGPDVQRKAEWLIAHGMYDYCGTDTHSMNYVRYFLNSTISKKIIKEVLRISKEQEL